MGCGCGGGKNLRSTRSSSPPTPAQTGTNIRQVQIQSAQRQALIQQARERTSQNQVNSLGTDAERNRRIQVSLRNRNARPRGS